jgi:hypothetical protein
MTFSQEQAPAAPPARPLSPRVWLPVVLFLLLAAWLGARELATDSLWNDEFYSIHDAGGPPYGPITPPQIWERVATRNAWHTPGFFILLSGWGAAVGWEPPALRVFSLLGGLLGIAWTYRLGRALLGVRPALYAVAILSTSAFFIHYLHELRMYAWFIPLTSFTFWVYLRILRQSQPHPLAWLGLLLGALGLLYMHYFAALPLAALMLYHLLFVPKNRRWWAVVLTLGLAGLLFLPWLRNLLVGLELAADSEQLHEIALGPGEALQRLVALFGNDYPWLTLAGLAAGGLALWKRARGAGKIWFFALVTLAAILLTNLVLEIMHGGRVRYLVSVWPLLALVIGVGIEQVRRLPGVIGPVVATLFVGLWAALGIYASVTPAFAADIDGGSTVFPVHRLVPILENVVQPDDVIFSFMPDGAPFWAYARNDEINGFYFNRLPVRSVTGRTTQDPDAQAVETRDELADIGDTLRFWLVSRPSFPNSNLPTIMSALGERYQQCRTLHDENDLRVELYTLTPLCCDADPNRPALIDYSADGGSIALTGFQPLPRTVDNTLPVVTSWRAVGVPANTYSVALHVLDADGTLVAQADTGLASLVFSCQRAYIDVSTVAPGQYTLAVILYRWQDGTRLPGTDAASGETGERLSIGVFQVE